MAGTSFKLPHLLPLPPASSFSKLVPASSFCNRINFCTTRHRLPLLSSHQIAGLLHRYAVKPVLAVGSGKEVSIKSVKGNAKVVIESEDENEVQVRVEMSGDETERVFSKVLADMARTAPPIPGFRRQKGGKTTKVPRDFLLQILGEERVTNFVIQEIVSSTMEDYVKKDNLKVKENKITTTQDGAELRKLFRPGNEFVFNVVLELEKTETEEAT